DTIGQIACAARIIEAIYRAYVNYRPVERWIAVLDALLLEDLTIRDQDVEMRAHCSLLIATVASRPRHPRLLTSIERISGMLAAGLEPDQVVTAGDALLRRFDWAVDVPKAQWVIRLVEDVVPDKSVASLAQLYWWTRVGVFYVHDARYQAAEAALRKANQIAVDFGLHTATFLLHLIWVFLHLARGDVEEARQRVERLVHDTRAAADWNLLFTRWAQSLLAVHTEPLDRAIELTRACLDKDSRNAPFFAKAQESVQLAALLAQSGALEELARLVDSTRTEIANTYMS